MSTEAIIWINGELKTLEDAAIAPDDLGFTLGLAVFETLLWENRQLYFVDRHLERMALGAAALAIPWPPPWELSEALQQFTAALDAAPRAVRLTLTRGRPQRQSTAVISSRPLNGPPQQGVVLAPSQRQLLPTSPETATNRSAVKATSRITYTLAREEAVAAGAWDALLPTTAGDYAETSIANLFIVLRDTVLTPPLERGCLNGVMRGLVIELLKSGAVPGVTQGSFKEARIDAQALREASEVWLTNSTGRVIPVRRILGLVDYPCPGPVSRALSAALREREAEVDLSPF